MSNQKWHSKASVQAALVNGIPAIFTAVIAIISLVITSVNSNKQLQLEKEQYHRDSINSIMQFQLITKQNDIANRSYIIDSTLGAQQIKIGLQQTAISQGLYKMNFIVATDVTYDATEKRLNIFNKGKENIWLWGDKFGDEPKSMNTEGRLVTPGASYYIFSEGMDSWILNKVGSNGEIRVPFELYIKDASSNSNIVKVILFIKVNEGKISIHTQTISITQKQW